MDSDTLLAEEDLLKPDPASLRSTLAVLSLLFKEFNSRTYCLVGQALFPASQFRR